MPNYKFKCPECGEVAEIQMRISEYHSDNHFCKCGAELKRDMKDVATDYVAKCTGLYGKTSV